MPRKPNERIKWFLSNNPSDVGMCLNHTWNATDIPSVGCDDANEGIDVVKAAGEMRSGPPPRGAWVWWRSSTHGHAALSLGDGTIASVDVNGPASTGVVSLSYPVNEWGHVYQGWSDFYGVRFDVGDDDDDGPLTDEEVDQIAKSIWQYELADSESRSGDRARPATWYINNILDKMKLVGRERRQR